MLGSNDQHKDTRGKSAGIYEISPNNELALRSCLLNSHKRRYSPHEKVLVSENVSAVLQRKLPPKLKDPGSFTIGITIGNKQAEKAMLDLGASINLMPYSVYVQLGLGELKSTTLSLQLADRSVKYPRGIVEDILVQVDKLILPADFVVLDMEDAPIHNRELPILLGRPFMATANTLIDVKNGILKMTVLGQTVEFKVFESLSHPSNLVDCFSIDCLDSLVFSKFVQAQSDDDLEIVLTQPLGDLDDEPEFMEVAAALEVSKPYHSSISPIIEPLEPASIKLVPSIVKPPKLELKPLPQHLKYVYLGYNQIAIAPEDQEKTTFTCPFGTFAYRRMPFGLCNAPATFQRCMMAIFSDMIERFIECHFMVKQGIVLGHAISSKVLGQRVNKLPHVIYYASRTLNDAQLNYSTTEKELLAVIFALEKFRSYLVGSKVIVYSDHAALRYLLTKKDAKPRLLRWVLLLQEFDLEIRDKKGCENVVADHLSRLIDGNHENKDVLPLNESFPDEQLLAIHDQEP
ncbi:unnamed protein product, partial [Prunus brigantina]